MSPSLPLSLWLPQLIPAVLFLVIAWLMPGVNRPTLPFGVRVPPEHVGDAVIVTQRRRYRWWVTLTGIVTVAVALAAPGVPLIPLAVVLCGVVPAYAYARAVILRTKRDERWYAGLTQAVTADTELRTDPERFPWLWAAPALIIIAVTVALGLSRYPQMPNQLAMHYNAQGEVDRFAAKSFGTAFALVFVQIGVSALILGLLAVSFRGKADLDPAAPRSSARQHRVFLQAMTKGTLVLIACVDVALLITSWFMWTGRKLSPWGVVVPVIVGIAGLISLIARTGQGGARIAVPAENPTGVVHRDDDRYWKGGLVYVNREDPAVFVPKRFGIGWTVNLANPKTLLVLLALVVFAATVRVLAR